MLSVKGFVSSTLEYFVMVRRNLTLILHLRMRTPPLRSFNAVRASIGTSVIFYVNCLRLLVLS
jgi:hypothetical protein